MDSNAQHDHRLGETAGDQGRRSGFAVFRVIFIDPAEDGHSRWTWVVALLPILVLVGWFGGKGDHSHALAAFLILLVAVIAWWRPYGMTKATSAGASPRSFMPAESDRAATPVPAAPRLWLVALLAPPLILFLFQAWCSGWMPTSQWWGASNRAALASYAIFSEGPAAGGVVHGISIDPDASAASAWWVFALLTYGIAVAQLIGPSTGALRSILMALVATGAIHALAALALAPFAPEWPAPGDVTAARGTFVSHNQAGAFWSLLLPVAILLWVRYGSPWGWPASMLGIAVVCSYSRGAVLCAAIVCLPLFWWLLPIRRRWWWIGGGIVLLAFAAWIVDVRPLGAHFSELSSPHEVSFHGRLSIWRAALPLIADAGPWGSGAGTTMLAWRRAGETAFEPQPVGHLHSDPLELLLEGGWAGSLLVATGAAISMLLVAHRSHSGRWRRTLVAGPMLGLATLVLHSFADFLFSNEAIAITAVLLAVVMATALATHESEMSRSSSSHGHIINTPQPGPASVTSSRWLPFSVIHAAPIAMCAILLVTVPWLERHEAADRAFVHLARVTTQLDSSKSAYGRRAIDLALNDADSAASSGRWYALPDARLLALDANLALERGEAKAKLLAEAGAHLKDDEGREPGDPAFQPDAQSSAPKSGAEKFATAAVPVNAVRAGTAGQGAAQPDPVQAMPLCDRDDWNLARLLLIQASLRCPAEPRAWLARARLALDAMPPQGAPAMAALDRAQNWGPAWMVGQAQAWNCLGMPGAAAIPLAQRQSLERLLLTPDLPQPPLAGRVAGKDLGITELEHRLLDQHPRTLASLAPWLRVHGTLATWLAARVAQEKASPCAIAPSAHIAASHAGLGDIPVALGASPRELQAQADEIQEAGLPVPAPLARALVQAGSPWSWWAVPLDPFEPETCERLRQLGDADQRWAARWSARAEAAAQLLAGDAKCLAAGADPLLIQGALAAVRAGRVRFATPGEADRLALLLVRLRRPQWMQSPGTMWAWVLNDASTPPMEVRLAGWMGVCVDGAWVGWRRGLIDLRHELQPGLHQVALLDL